MLAKLQPGYLPQRLFDEVNRLHVSSTIVIVPLRRAQTGLEVLLIKRGFGPTDPVWPGHWHLPGTMLRPNDKEGDYSDAFQRILQGELKNTATSGEQQFILTAFTETKRGREHTQLYWIEIVGEPAEGEFFPVDQLPSPIIEHEKAYIQEAAKIASL
ncbi:MAG TPA: NUDIX hydrolase [Nitrososphaera sp.]|nr:NUDIX hydrolase [Nitrososphaera sp.]